MKSTVKERLTEYLKLKGISKSAFGREVEVSAAYVNSITRTINPEILKRIRLKYPDLNTDWLLLGEGEMLKTQSTNSVVTGNVSGNGNQIVAGTNMVLQDKEADYKANHPKREDVEIIEPEEVGLKETVILTPEIVNKPGIDIKQELELGTLPAPVKLTQDIVPLHDAKVYLENDEMAPDIEANDPVLIRFMETKEAIVPGRMYFVDIYRCGVVRWVFPQPNGSLLLCSTNTPNMEVSMDSVKSIAEVVAIWKRPKTMQSEKKAMLEVLSKRDEQLDNAQRMLEKSGNRSDTVIGELIRMNRERNLEYEKADARVNRVIDQNQQLINTLIDVVKEKK